MNSTKTLILAMAITVTSTSCATVPIVEVIAPYYATTSNLAEIIPGMNFGEVHQAMGIDPYDIYMSNDEGLSVAVWYYKHPARELNPSFVSDASYGPQGGDPVVENLERLFMIFRDGVLDGFITEESVGVEEFPNDILQYLLTVEVAFTPLVTAVGD